MGDEQSGPYKVVAKLNRDPRQASRYAIAVQRRNDLFQSEIIPDAGTGDTARTVCNLLNKAHKKRLEESGEEGNGAGAPDGEWESSDDQ